MTENVEILIRAKDQASKPIDNVRGSLHSLRDASRDTVKNGLDPLRNVLATGLKAAAVSATAALAGLTALAVNSVKVASNIEEMGAKFDVVFGGMAQQVREQLKGMADDMNRSRFDLEKFAASAQDLFVPLGFARDVAADMSVELTKLAVDVASFNDAAESDVMANFTSALVGNHEAVRSYGIVLTEATLKQELARIGADELTGAALEQAKVQARLNLIVSGTSDAHDDATRTAGSFANQMRGLFAALLDVRAGIGAEILPVLTPFIEKLTELIKEIGPDVVKFFGTWAERIATFAEESGLGGLIMGFVDFFRDIGHFQENYDIGFWGALKFAIVEALGPDSPAARAFLTLMDFVRDTVRVLGFLFGKGKVFDDDPEWLIAIHDAIMAVRGFIGWIWELLAPIREWIAANFSLEQGITLGLLVALGALGRAMFGWIAGPVGAIIKALWAVVSPFKWLTLAAAALWLAWETNFLDIQGLVGRFVEAVGGPFTNLWNAIKEFGVGALQEIWTFVTGGETNFENLKRILEAARLAWDALWGFLKDEFNRFLEWLLPTGEEAWARFKEMFAALVQFVQDNLPSWMATLGEWGKAAIDWIIVAIQFLFGKAVELFQALTIASDQEKPKWVQKLGEWATAAWQWIVDVTPTVVAELGRLLKAFFESWLQAEIALFAMLFSWGRALVNWIIDVAPEVLAAIWNDVLSPLINLLVQNFPTWVTKLGEWATATWQWIVDAWVQMQPHLVTWVGNLIGWIENNLPTWIATLGEWGKAAWRWIVDAALAINAKIREWAQALTVATDKERPPWVKKLQEWGTALWEWVVKAVPKMISELAGGVGRMLKAMANLTADLLMMLASWGKLLWQWIVDATPEVIRTLGEWLGKIQTWWDGEGGKKFRGTVTEWAAIIWDFVVEATKTIGTTLGNWVSAIGAWWTGDGGRDFREFVVTWDDIAWEWLKSAIGMATTQLQDWWKAINDWWTGTGGDDFRETASQWSTTAWEWIKKANEEATAQLDRWMDVIEGWVENQGATDLGAAFGKFLVEAFRWLVDAITQLPGKLNEWLTEIQSWSESDQGGNRMGELFVQLGKDLIGGFFSGFAEQFELEFPKTAELIGGIVSWFKEFFGIESPSTLFKGFGEEIVQGLFDGMSDKWSTVSENVSDLWDSLKTAAIDKFDLDESPNAFGKFGEDLITGFKDGVSKKWTTIKQNVEDTWDKVKTSFVHKFDLDKTVNKFEGYADDLLTGFRNGVTKAMPGLTKWLGERWRSISDTFTTHFDIFSPSGLFKSYGESLMDGLETGIQNRESNVTTALGNIATAADNVMIGVMNSIDQAANAADGIANSIMNTAPPPPANAPSTVTIQDSGGNDVTLFNAVPHDPSQGNVFTSGAAGQPPAGAIYLQSNDVRLRNPPAGWLTWGSNYIYPDPAGGITGSGVSPASSTPMTSTSSAPLFPTIPTLGSEFGDDATGIMSTLRRFASALNIINLDMGGSLGGAGFGAGEILYQVANFVGGTRLDHVVGALEKLVDVIDSEGLGNQFNISGFTFTGDDEEDLLSLVQLLNAGF